MQVKNIIYITLLVTLLSNCIIICTSSSSNINEEEIKFLQDSFTNDNEYTSDETNNNAKLPFFDMYVFSVQWGPNYCLKSNSDKCFNKLKTLSSNGNLTIHGLWPSSKKQPIIGTCNTGKEIKVQATNSPPYTEMKQVWPTLSSSNTNASFWTHEFNKHGFCYTEKYHYGSYEVFFKKTLSLYHSEGIDRVFSKAFPSGDDEEITYSMKEFTSMLSKANNGDNFDLKCDHFDGKQYIAEIRFLYDMDFKKLNGFKQQPKCNDNQDVTIYYDSNDSVRRQSRK